MSARRRSGKSDKKYIIGAIILGQYFFSENISTAIYQIWQAHSHKIFHIQNRIKLLLLIKPSIYRLRSSHERYKREKFIELFRNELNYRYRY